ncbi:MAG: 50S ribosomal protein L10 [Nanoarchaeota archaeon]|nr:50S ribosomal protein L10 [Nanoarchaeota archaeon]
MAQARKISKPVKDTKVPDYKIKLVKDLADMIKASRTVLVASTKGLPSAHFHSIKKNLRGKADIKIARKSAILRALEQANLEGLPELEKNITSDIALFLSDLDAFELSALLNENQSPAKARAGDVAPEDITVEPGPTDLIPGPAISELSGVGLKVAVEGGKLAIKQPATIVHKGDTIKENVASVMTKLNIMPMKVGFDPIAAYDAKAAKVYVGIRIDKKQAATDLRVAISKALSFAVNVKYPTAETIKFFLAKAAAEEKAIQALIDKSQTNTQQNVQGG